MTYTSEAQPLVARARSRERGPAVIGVVSALISTVMPQGGVWWLLFSVAAAIGGLIAVWRMVSRAGVARQLAWSSQPAVGIGSFWVAGILTLVCLRGQLPSVWVWSLAIVAMFVTLFGIFMLVELLVSRDARDGTPSGETQGEYGTVVTVAAVLAAIALVVVSAILH